MQPDSLAAAVAVSRPLAKEALNKSFDKLVWFFTAFLGKLRDAGVEGHRLASAVFATDRRTENSPTHTASVDEESSGK